MSASIEHGISMGSDKSSIPSFDGTDPTLVAGFLMAMVGYLTSKRIPMPFSITDENWLRVEPLLYAEKPASRVLVDQALLDANPWMVQVGYKVDDLNLTSKERREYDSEKLKLGCLKQLAVSVFRQHIVPGSAAETCITRGYNLNDFRIMYFEFKDFYEGLLLHNVLSHAQRYVALFMGGTAKGAIILLDQLMKARSDFFKLLRVDQKLPTETDVEFGVRLGKAHALWSYSQELILLENATADKDHVRTFVTQHLREILTDVNDFNPVTNCAMLRTFLSTHVNVQVKAPVVKPGVTLVTDKQQVSLTQANNRIKNLQAKLNRANSAAVVALPGKTVGAKRGRNGTGPCSLCKSGDHDLEHCYKNPNASEDVKKRAEAYRARNLAVVNMVTTEGEAADPMLDAMNTSSSSSGNIKHKLILLDGGSDCVLFNRFHHNLLFSLKPYSSALSGIGGDAGIRITQKGDVIFMGSVLHDVLYSPTVDKSVVSEGLLCSVFGYKIAKEADSCILTNATNNTTFTLQLDTSSMQYVIPASLFDINSESHAINLASVRPSNLKTLWHGRFGHAYLGLIIKMARSKIYSDRGLKLPDALLKVDPDEDLCDACALGKPTFSFSYTQQFRSTVKGKLWYFDVSGGGNLTPSLVNKNRYIYMFADSCTRMYFSYYTKRVDDRTTLRVLHLFREEVLSTLTFDDTEEITFFQSDKDIYIQTRSNFGCVREDRLSDFLLPTIQI